MAICGVTKGQKPILIEEGSFTVEELIESRDHTVKIKDAVGEDAIEKLFLIDLHPERKNVSISKADSVLPDSW